jgi:hypothetical protein
MDHAALQGSLRLCRPAKADYDRFREYAFCIKPRRQMTERQIVNTLKAASAAFTTIRHLAMRFRGLLRGGTGEKLDAWLHDARRSGICGMQRFASALRHDIEAVREAWSNGQTEGQINRLKTLKRSMYGRAGVDLAPKVHQTLINGNTAADQLHRLLHQRPRLLPLSKRGGRHDAALR